MKHPVFSLSISLFLLFSSAGFSQSTKSYAFINASLFNGKENKIYSGSVLFTKGGKIERVGKSGEPTGGYEVIDCEGYFLMPGLIDAHSHLDNLAAAKRALETGVTTVRTAGVSAFQDVALMELSRTGKIAGPDVVPAGVYVSPQLEETILADTRLGVLLNGVRTDDELKLLVNVNIDRGAKVIKTRGTERAVLKQIHASKCTQSTRLV